MTPLDTTTTRARSRVTGSQTYLDLDGISVCLYLDENDGRIGVQIDTQDASDAGKHHSADGTPWLDVFLNDARLHDAGPPPGPLTQDDPRLLQAVRQASGFEPLVNQTGGGCTVLAIDLTQDCRLMGRQIWLSREDEWIVGVYDFAADPDDQGVCFTLMIPPNERDNPMRVAREVAGILNRLGVRLQG
jgi:hypothetical protein